MARSSSIAKDDIRSRPKEVAANYAALIGGTFVANQLTGLSGRRPPPYNVTVSCLPRPAAPFYLAGARLEAMYPLACIYHGAPYFVASFTISGSIGFVEAVCGAQWYEPSTINGIAAQLRNALPEHEARSRNSHTSGQLVISSAPISTGQRVHSATERTSNSGPSTSTGRFAC